MGGIGGELFGKKESQQQQQTNQTIFRPQDQARLEDQTARYQGQANQVADLFANLSNRALNNNLQTNAGLNTQFSRPQFGPNLDPTSQALMAQEFQNRGNQLQTQQNQIAQQFRNNPALAQILQAQAGSQAQLANNPLAFQAMNAQGARQIEQANFLNQVQGLENQAKLAGAEFGNQARLGNLQNLVAAGNFGQGGLQAQGGVYDMLRSFAQGNAQTTGTGATQAGSRGLMGGAQDFFGDLSLSRGLGFNS